MKPFGKDKIKHFIAGLLLSSFGLIWLPLILLGLIFAIGKEVYDLISGKGIVDFYDFLATASGSIVIIIIIFAISLMGDLTNEILEYFLELV